MMVSCCLQYLIRIALCGCYRPEQRSRWDDGIICVRVSGWDVVDVLVVFDTDAGNQAVEVYAMTIGPEPPKRNVVLRVIYRLCWYAVYLPATALDLLVRSLRNSGR